MALDFKIERMSEELNILRLSGLFEGLEVANERSKLVTIVQENTTTNLFLDMAEIEYMDSMAISVLIEMAKMAQEKGVKLSIINANKNLKKVLQVTKVDKILTIED